MNNLNLRVVDRKEEKPPHSRIFVVCSKLLREEDLRPCFQRYGTVEDIFVPKDRSTGESKGIAYIKYAKTSSAAVAIQELHLKSINNDSKPIKVMLAINKNGGPTQNENEDKYRRLFIKVDRDASENDTRNDFSSFGHVESVHFQRDKHTDACKGFAYVQFKTFYEAAIAFEECDRKYKPMFATPRDDLKRSRNSLDFDSYPSTRNSYERFNQPKSEFQKPEKPLAVALNNTEEYHTVVVKCSPGLPQKHIEQIFNIIPSMEQCQYSVDTYNGFSKAVIMYKEAKYAAFAVDRLNNFEFPSGEILSVKPESNPLAKAAYDLTNIVNSFKNAVDTGTPDLLQLADAIAQASSLIKAATSVKVQNADTRRESHDNGFCNVSLPPHQEIANQNSKVAQRLFIICKPHPPPIPTLQDVFCRFGDLINVSTIPNKTFGFVKYASVKAAQEAIKSLNGAIVCGIRLKVLEADEKPSKDEDSKINNDHIEANDYDLDSKRIKLDSSD